MKDGYRIEFTPTNNGLWVHPLDNLQDIQSMWSMVTTVSEKACSTQNGLQMSNDGTETPISS
jgi:hypothetical protein